MTPGPLNGSRVVYLIRNTICVRITEISWLAVALLSGLLSFAFHFHLETASSIKILTGNNSCSRLLPICKISSRPGHT